MLWHLTPEQCDTGGCHGHLYARYVSIAMFHGSDCFCFCRNQGYFGPSTPIEAASGVITAAMLQSPHCISRR
ncbi:hypothetical protein PISMIDRAFT_173450 [Pisolithus microcarpus 441]|uniref:Uncharacterized protein n=1 Tax=Pisolithus microcarpus 441 TaxID=765257 RepID=A0A0C9ZG20_9AGAM|nr:hypothetical protein PISMIDRAFT_173450 [Pisolithus microcarpus 441]